MGERSRSKYLNQYFNYLDLDLDLTSSVEEFEITIILQAVKKISPGIPDQEAGAFQCAGYHNRRAHLDAPCSGGGRGAAQRVAPYGRAAACALPRLGRGIRIIR